MTTDIIDCSLHTSSFPANYIGPGTLIGNCRQSSDDDAEVQGYFTSDGNAVQLNLGFRPLEVEIINMTDGIEWEWNYGMAATDTIKTTFTGPVIAVDTTSAIVPSEPAPNGGGNWIVTLSAAAVGTGKLILFTAEG